MVIFGYEKCSRFFVLRAGEYAFLHSTRDSCAFLLFNYNRKAFLFSEVA